MSQHLEGRGSKLASKAKWPLFLVANAALLLVIGVSTVRETYQGWSVDREISALEQKAQSLEGRRSELTVLAAQMQSPDYVEREARAKLGLQKPGEHVVVLQGVSTVTSADWSEHLADAAPAAPADRTSNPERWWQYFTQGMP